MTSYTWKNGVPTMKKVTARQKAQREWSWTRGALKGNFAGLSRIMQELGMETSENTTFLRNLYAELDMANDDRASSRGVDINYSKRLFQRR